MSKNFTVGQIREWRKDTVDAKLFNREILDKYTDIQLCSIFNGIGPDRFPSWLRWIVSHLHPSLMAVALIHDTEWYERDNQGMPEAEPNKTAYQIDLENFHASNERFKQNGLLIAKYLHGKFNPIRYIVELNAITFAKCCNTDYGYNAWSSQ